MKIKSIIGIDECAGCRDYCCKFEKSGWDAAPVFLAEEYKRVKNKIAEKKYFKPFKNSTAKQIILKKGEQKEYFCPFFDRAGKTCSIQSLKPFDCRFFPLAFMKGQDGRGLYVACFNEKICVGLAKAGREKIEKYKKYIVEIFGSKAGRDFAKNYPQILDYDDDADLIFKVN